MFHLGWFLGNGFGIQAWSPTNGDGPWVGRNVTDWTKPDLYVDMVQSLERAGFDFLMIEDTAMIEDTFGGNAESTLRRGFMAPKNDPMPLIPLLTQATKSIGVISTVSTIQYHPYLAARLFTTLDHLTEGRVGMNVVTSVTDRVAQNFGYDEHLDHDERYLMAMEWVEVVQQLQDSWKEGAIVADPVKGVYADHTKVQAIDFVGKYFRSRGPLNTIPGPQRIVPVCSAGSSGPGRDLAAAYDDTMISIAPSVAAAKEYREDMHERIRAAGRDPEKVKLLFLVSPIIGATDEDAQAQAAAAKAHTRSDSAVEQSLWQLTYSSGGRIDFGGIDPDTLVSDIDLTKGNGEQSALNTWLANTDGLTLRDLAVGRGLKFLAEDYDFTGSPDTVAAQMGEATEEIGGDGFLVYLPTTRANFAKVSDGLAPALRRRGLIRDGYAGSTLRDHLTEF
jgi:FMN-dependent oxidoreductase (nitrilotriacetate monooxygenase family)